MVWGCFSWNGVGAFHQIKGMLTKQRYRQILIRQMRPSARRLHEVNFIFQHDNFDHVRVFSDHYLIQNKNYDFYLSILISESGVPLFVAKIDSNSP